MSESFSSLGVSAEVEHSLAARGITEPFRIQTLVIPDNAVPDASKLVVKLYPGVFSQILEGVEGLIRLPGG